VVTLVSVVFAWRSVPLQDGQQVHSSAALGQAPLENHVPRSRGLVQPPIGVLSFGTAWVQGFLEGGTITFLSLYLLSLGYNEAGVGTLLGGLFAGVILAQLPLATLADRLGRLRILLLCHALIVAGLASVPRALSPALLQGWLFVLGACCGALYPLGLALLGERVRPDALARANAWYLASNCAGSLSGPILLGLAIDAFGLGVQFTVGMAAVVCVLGIWMVLARRECDEPLARTQKPSEESRRADEAERAA
jgi:MFS family permease